MNTCVTDGCKGEAFCKGLCEYHYRKSRMSFRSPCSFENCGKPAVARGLCNNHYAQYRQKEIADGGWNPHVASVCSIPGCPEKHIAKGLCQKHYSEEIRRVNRETLRARYFPDGIRCGKCGKEFEWRQMDAHHPDPKRKEHILSEVVNNSALQKRPALLAELDECEMLCARCHQNLHHDPATTHEATYLRKDKGHRIDEMKELVRQKFGERCSSCGDWLYPKEMEFHHKDSGEKKDNVSDMMRIASFEDVLAEVMRCDVLCRNCHRLMPEKSEAA